MIELDRIINTHIVVLNRKEDKAMRVFRQQRFGLVLATLFLQLVLGLVHHEFGDLLIGGIIGGETATAVVVARGTLAICSGNRGRRRVHHE
jgi:hypothetical protein